MKSLWFVVPAWQRYELTKVCLEQKLSVIDHLLQKDIDCSLVLVADDANLDIAKSLDFHTVVQNNDWLGRKFNDGIEYAANHGADWIVPIGSDSWIHPSFFDKLPPDDKVMTSRLYTAVKRDKMAKLKITSVGGVGPYVLPYSILQPLSFRPVQDKIKRGIDRSTRKSLGDVEWVNNDLFHLQYVGFRGTPTITSYDSLVKFWKVSEHNMPWTHLASHYDRALVKKARKALKR